jgi:TRAP-type mannitol/chloroaromatic compound transport system permease large subunit
VGLDIDILWLTVLLFGSLGLLLALGLPMAFCTGSLAVIFLFVFDNGAILNMMPSRIFPFMTDYQLSAVPLFIFMAAMLEKAGIIEELFDAVYKWLGSVKEVNAYVSGGKLTQAQADSLLGGPLGILAIMAAVPC